MVIITNCLYDGEVLALEDVPPGTEMVASAGEEFRPLRSMAHCMAELRYQEEAQEARGRRAGRASPHPRDRPRQAWGGSDGESSPPLTAAAVTAGPGRVGRSRRRPDSRASGGFQRSVSQEILDQGVDSARASWEDDMARLGPNGKLLPPADKALRRELEAGELEPEELSRLRAQMQKQQDALEQTKARLHMHSVRSQSTALFPASPTKIIHGGMGRNGGSVRHQSPNRQQQARYETRRGPGGPFGSQRQGSQSRSASQQR